MRGNVKGKPQWTGVMYHLPLPLPFPLAHPSRPGCVPTNTVLEGESQIGPFCVQPREMYTVDLFLNRDPVHEEVRIAAECLRSGQYSGGENTERGRGGLGEAFVGIRPSR
jgi:hypothetical protein